MIKVKNYETAHPYLKEELYSGETEYESVRRIFVAFQKLMTPFQTKHSSELLRDERLLENFKIISKNLMGFIHDIGFTENTESLRIHIIEYSIKNVKSMENCNRANYKRRTIGDKLFPILKQNTEAIVDLSWVLSKKRKYFKTEGLAFMYGKGFRILMNNSEYIPAMHKEGTLKMINKIIRRLKYL